MMQKRTEQNINRVYDFIQGYIDEEGFSPSIREIAEACFVSTSTALRYVDRLQVDKRLTRVEGVARSIRLLDVE